MYSENDIKVTNVKDNIKKRPEMFFGSRGINPEAICTVVAEGALILGAAKTEIQHFGEWWFICADVDWMIVDTKIEEANEINLFERTFGFPEMGVNNCRWEAFTNFFSDATLTTTTSGTRQVSGDDADKEEYISVLNQLGEYRRVIGFKFNRDA